MIKIDPKPMSDEERVRYEKQVLLPGKRWLATHPNTTQKPRDYWREIQLDLARTFHLRCAYTATFLNYNGQVDHFVSINEDREKAYDWDNFRYCVGWVNAKKQNLPSAKLLDPLLVEDDWFELSVPDLQLRVTEHCPAELRDKAEFMLEKLGLRNHQREIENRATYWNLYQEKRAEVLPFLEREAPLVARAARKHLAENAP